MDKFKIGDRVLYMPPHAYGDPTHKDCEKGVISAVQKNHAFVRFDKDVQKNGWDNTMAKCCYFCNLHYIVENDCGN